MGRGIAAWALAGVLFLGCGGGGGNPTNPNDVDIPAADQQALSASLTGLSGQLAAAGLDQDAIAAGAAAVVIRAANKASSVTVTTAGSAAAVRARRAGPGTYDALGFQITFMNSLGPSQTSGVLVWQGTTEVILTSDTATSGSFPTAFGLVQVPPTQTWSATAGTESSMAVADVGPCPAATLPPGVTSCTLASFTGGFDITASTPASLTGNTASGSQTATLGSGHLYGVKLTVDCSQTALCGATPGGVNITNASLPDGIVGQTYTQPLAASGGTMPYQYTLVPGTGNLPPGLSLAGGQISGTPTQEGASSFYLIATDSSQPAAMASLPRPFGITIRAAAPMMGCATLVGTKLTRQVSGSDFGATDSVVMVVDSIGNPYVAWSELKAPSVQTFVRHFDGAAWQPLGQGITHASGGLAMTLYNGNPVVALLDTGTTGSECVVDLWDGSSWNNIGDPAFEACAGVDLSVDATGGLLLAWTHYGPWQVVVSRYDGTGTSWSEVGHYDSSTTGLAKPSVAADPSGNVYVAWDEPMSTGSGTPPTYTPHVYKLPSTDYGSPAGSANHDRSQPSLVADAQGPVIAWLRYPTAAVDAVEVDRGSGSGWTMLGVAPASLRDELIATPTGLAVAAVTGFGHADVYKWNSPMSWNLVCSLVDPDNPMGLATGVTGVALGQDANGDYRVAAVNNATGAIFVEKVTP